MPDTRSFAATLLTPAEAARFWTDVDQAAGPDSCWLWQRYRSPRGYGKVCLWRPPTVRTLRAHRVAYALTHGSVPAQHLLHTCDNPSCCNPGHLELGNAIKNGQDGVLRRRRTNLRLQPAWIPDIRQRVAAGETQASVARTYGVHVMTINHVILRRCWEYV